MESAAALRLWFSTLLFRGYLQRFVLLWIAGKIANALIATSPFIRLPPLAFRPGAEIVACAAEMLVLWTFTRRAHEDLFLANLGVGPATVLTPFVVLHLVLSGVVALAA